MSEPTIIPCDDLGDAIQKYTESGYRLDMIFPADSPREALMSEPPAVAGGMQACPHSAPNVVRLKASAPPAYAGGSDSTAGGSDWVNGRAGMEYRDLIPGRLGGKAIASHIRLMTAGEVPDYVHYHKVDFQMIYCLKGRIRVVYEDQGAPFWLETGDCVVQPPEIRHRVLECTAGAEVLEVTMPAEHETWVEHEMSLPNDIVNPDREFNGQRFYRFQESSSDPFVGAGYVRHLTDVTKILQQKLSISVESFVDRDNNSTSRGWFAGTDLVDLVYVLEGALEIIESKELPTSFDPGKRFGKDDCFILPPNTAFIFEWSHDLKLANVRIAI